MAKFDASQLVADIVLDHPRAGRVFEGLHIDFCCGGRVSLADACKAQSVDETAVLVALEAALAGEPSGERDFRSLTTMALIAYVVDRHHGYLREVLPEVTRMAEKVSRVHGDKSRDAAALGEQVRELAAILDPHLDHEETVLFPMLLSAGAESHEAELAAMDADHLVVGAKLEHLRQLTSDFTVPEWGCNTVRALFAALEELEGDVHRHVHLENNVLMPRFSAARASTSAACC